MQLKDRSWIRRSELSRPQTFWIWAAGMANMAKNCWVEVHALIPGWKVRQECLHWLQQIYLIIDLTWSMPPWKVLTISKKHTMWSFPEWPSIILKTFQRFSDLSAKL